MAPILSNTIVFYDALKFIYVPTLLVFRELFRFINNSKFTFLFRTADNIVLETYVSDVRLSKWES